MNAACKPNEFFLLLGAREFKRTKTKECVNNALNVVKDYMYWGQITQREYERIKSEIKSAPYDDAISDIMTNLRKRIYN